MPLFEFGHRTYLQILDYTRERAARQRQNRALREIEKLPENLRRDIGYRD